MLSPEEKVAVVRNTELFQKIAPEHLNSIASRMGEKRFPAGEMLFREGDLGSHMFLVCQGRVEILKGKDTVLAVLEKGDILGEMAPLSGQLRSTGARAKEDTTVLFLKAEAFRLLIHKMPNLAVGIIRLLSRRLMASNAQIAQMGKAQESAWVLRVESGFQKGESVGLPEHIVIGRGEPKAKAPGRMNLGCGESSRISRVHAEISKRGSEYFLKDLGTPVGTTLNGVGLEEIVSLKEGDRIGIGEVELGFYQAKP